MGASEAIVAQSDQAPALALMAWSGDYFARRWHGRIPAAVLLWPEMLGVGTAVNLVATLLAVTVVIQGGPGWLAALLHLAPTPYNIYLFAALWRAPDRTALAMAIALAWLVAMMLV
jgi:hypothetical protein